MLASLTVYSDTPKVSQVALMKWVFRANGTP